MRLLGSLVHATGRFCERLAALETRVADEHIAGVEVRAPIFIAGVARSGSTILLEALASLQSFASLRYCDYPAVWFPWWWQQLRERLPLPKPTPQQRAHRDRIAVTPESPEAYDEIFWMHFFEGRHDPSLDQRLGHATSNARFEAFYPLQIRKLLAARGRPRYLSKGNYNLARLPYLLSLFPDARFVVPVREPAAHVASLIKQHRLFCKLSEGSRSVAAHLARTGHFEFGPQRRVECLGDPAEAAAIAADFCSGDDVAGYARQWSSSYGSLLEQLQGSPELSDATLLVRYEQLCAEPGETLQRIAEHCRLDAQASLSLITTWAGQLAAPGYYQTSFDSHEQQRITAICAATAARLGYSTTSG